MICYNAVRADACFVASAINGTTAWKLRRSANVHGARRRSCARLGMAAPVASHGAEGPGPERNDIPTNSSPHRVQTNPAPRPPRTMAIELSEFRASKGVRPRASSKRTQGHARSNEPRPLGGPGSWRAIEARRARVRTNPAPCPSKRTRPPGHYKRTRPPAIPNEPSRAPSNEPRALDALGRGRYDRCEPRPSERTRPYAHPKQSGRAPSKRTQAMVCRPTRTKGSKSGARPNVPGRLPVPSNPTACPLTAPRRPPTLEAF